MVLRPEINKAVEEVLTDLADILAQVKEIKSFNIPLFLKVVYLVVQKVEYRVAHLDGWTGADKRLLATTVLNQLVNVPILPEWIEEKIIGLIVDVVVGTYNEVMGKTWSLIADSAPDAGPVAEAVRAAAVEVDVDPSAAL